jgi:hypothetical protein
LVAALVDREAAAAAARAELGPPPVTSNASAS